MYTLYYRWKDRRTNEKINNAYMKFIIEPGTFADINELEKLYDELNDYLAGTISYPGWIKGIYLFILSNGFKSGACFSYNFAT